MKWRAIERATAPTSHGFTHGGMESRDWFSLRLQTHQTAWKSD